MRSIFDSDVGFYYAVGGFTIAVFLAALAALARVTPGGVGGTELAGLVGGFVLFMLAYFVSIGIRRIEEGEDV